MENSGSGRETMAVIFDLDGTLLNTELVTKNVLKEFLARYGKAQDTEKENKRLGLTLRESSVAIVNDYHLPLTPEQYIQEIIPMYHGKWLLAKALPGADRLMAHLHYHGIPFALASNSLRKNIDAKISQHHGWKERFAVILGSDQVESGKPSPDIFLEAAKRMEVDPSHCLVIEDSIVGVRAGKAAGMKVVAVPSLQTDPDSYLIADTIVRSLLEFEPEQWGLPPFEDWMLDALPIEPIHQSGGFSKGVFHHNAESELLLPDQIWGLFIGWVKPEGPNVFKSVISIGWSDNSKRKIQICMLEGTELDEDEMKLELVITGYLKRSTSLGRSVEIAEEDKRIADAALNSPAFSSNF